MTILSSIILGIIEGITEFLPISSTFHLIYASKLLQIPSSDFLKLFEVAIQAGAILALLVLTLRFLDSSTPGESSPPSSAGLRNTPGVSLSSPIGSPPVCLSLYNKVLVSFLPTAAIGFALYKIIKNVFFESNLLMVSVFMAVGLLFFLLESLVSKNKIKLYKSLSSLTYKEAFLIGLMQSLAIIPGVSRAGIVMVAMMTIGYKRTEAAFYSFFLAIPTIFAASIFDLYKSKDIVFNSDGNIIMLLIGFISAFISAYFTLRWFIAFLKKNSLVCFGVYRMVLGLTLLLC